MKLIIDTYWVKNSCALTASEIRSAAEPCPYIREFWPVEAIQEWKTSRTHGRLRWPRGQCDIRPIDRAPALQQSAAALRTARDILRSIPFHLWTWKVYAADPSVENLLAMAKQNAPEHVIQELDHYNATLTASILAAHYEASNLDMVCRRLKVLQCRFDRMLRRQASISGQDIISTDFSFVTMLSVLDLELIATALSTQCGILYRQVKPEDLREETEVSNSLAKWWNELHYNAEECLQAGLERNVRQVAELLWSQHNHYSSNALRETYQPLQQNYREHFKARAGSGGFLSDLAALRKWAKELQSRKEMENQRALLLATTKGVLEWGDERQARARFHIVSQAEDTSEQNIAPPGRLKKQRSKQILKS